MGRGFGLFPWCKQTLERYSILILFWHISQSDKRAHKKRREESAGNSESERDITPQNHMAGQMMQLRQSEDYEGGSDEDEDDSYIFGQHDSVWRACCDRPRMLQVATIHLMYDNDIVQYGIIFKTRLLFNSE